MNNNLAAFLKMIRFAEGTAGANGYRTVYAYEKVLQDLSDHPVTTGEWTGKKLSVQQCKNAGIASGNCKSTAAGAYQFIFPTWNRLKTKLKLKDFSPQSQDLAALELLRECGAYQEIEAGRIENAIQKAAPIWASLPGNYAKQPQKRLAELKTIYNQSGGVLIA